MTYKRRRRLSLSKLEEEHKKKEDEESTNNNSPSIIGAWTLNTVILESDTSSSTFPPEDISFPTSVEFIAGGILYENFSGDLDTNEWLIIGDSLYIGEGGEDIERFKVLTNVNVFSTSPILTSTVSAINSNSESRKPLLSTLNIICWAISFDFLSISD